MKQLYLVITFCLLHLLAFAQKDFRTGYVIQNGDTIHGFVDYRGALRSSKITNFKPELEAVEQQLTPAQITGYGFNKERKHYESHTVPATEAQEEQQLFLNTLIKGKASIYYYRDAGSADHYYLSKDDGELIKLTQTISTNKDPNTGKLYKVADQAYLRALARAFSDCPDLNLNKLNSTSLTERSLINAAEEYNTCQGGDILYEQQPRKAKVVIGPVLFYAKPKLTTGGVHTYSDIDFSTTGLGLGAGLSFNFSMPVTSEKLSLQLEALYAPHTFEANLPETFNNGRVTNRKLMFDIGYLKFPAQLRYTFPKGKLRPFVNTGIAYSYAVRVNQLVQTSSSFHSTSSFDESEALSDGGFRRYMFGYVAGAGFSYPLATGSLQAEARYEVHDGFSNLLALTSRIKGMSFLVGYNF